MKNQASITPFLVAVVTYGVWGLLPVYWKLFAEVPALEVLAHRVFWSFFFLYFLILIMGNWKSFISETSALLSNRRRMISLILGSVFLSLNWLTFIWAVNHDRVVESGLGYYILPLLNVLVGVVFLNERLSMWQLAAVGLAAIGVVYLTVNYGSLPAVALALAFSMTVYGVCKKIACLSAISGITLETTVLFPVVLLYFIVIYGKGEGYPLSPSPTLFFLAGAGVVTAVPLITFAYCLNRLPLSVVGLISYLSPSLTLVLGVFVYDEAFTAVHMTAFAFIWSGLILFSAAKSPPLSAIERRVSRLLRRLWP